MSAQFIGEWPLARWIFSSPKLAWLWLVVRVYVGWQWLEAGWGKIHNNAWVGEEAGKALAGFIKGALLKTTGAHPDVQSWYATFLHDAVLPQVTTWSYVVAYGEFLVGLGLIVGAFTGIAAFFGLLMNVNFMLAGAVSINPVLAVLSLLLMLAWRSAGYWGADRYLLPLIGTPWHRGKILS